MTPAQVCVLFVALLGGGAGAPLAHAAPAPARGRVLHQMIADRLGGAAPAVSDTPEPLPAVAGDTRTARHFDEQTDYDYYYMYEYDDPAPEDAGADPVGVLQAAAVGSTEYGPVTSATGSGRGRPGPTPEERVAMGATTGAPASDVQTESESESGASESTVRPVLSSPAAIVTVRPSSTSEPPAEATAPARRERPQEEGRARPELSVHTSSGEASEEEKYTTVFGGSNNVKDAQMSTILGLAAVPTSSTTSPSPSITSQSPKSSEISLGNGGKISSYTRSKPPASSSFSNQLNEVRQSQPEANEIDFEPQASSSFENHPASANFEQEASSSDKVLAYQLRAANLEEPRQQPQFFVPPIVRRPYRRRVPLTGGGRRSNSPSLGDRLAEQVRRQLQTLQRREQAQAGYQHPFIPSPPTTTERPYKHPFIPTPPSTTNKPYEPPFIPTPPSTTKRPYKPPFIPTPPTTTSRPYQHPFIPSAPTPTPEPYRHPFVPVPPSATERPQARRVGGDGPRSQATIVHQETLEAGFIVGEYGVVHGSGKVRGVKYAADSNVDRRLLEAALAQFLTL